MKLLVILIALWLTSCSPINQPLIHMQPRIAAYDERAQSTEEMWRWSVMMGREIDEEAIIRHRDISHAFYVAMEVAFVQGDQEAFDLNLERAAEQLLAMEKLLVEPDPTPKEPEHKL